MPADKVWSLAGLPELKAGDSLAFKAEGTVQQFMVKLIGAETFHWGLVGEKQINDEISVGDWSVVDSLGKGITTHLLSEYQCRHMRVYRPRLPEGEQDRLRPYLLKRYSYYGDQHYDWKGVVMVGLWCILHKLGSSVEWWEHNSSAFWCLEFNNLVLRDFGYPLVPDSEPPYPYNMEHSGMLELIWGTF